MGSVPTYVICMHTFGVVILTMVVAETAPIMGIFPSPLKRQSTQTLRQAVRVFGSCTETLQPASMDSGFDVCVCVCVCVRMSAVRPKYDVC